MSPNDPLLQVFGLDKYSGSDAQTPTPDGNFDFRPGRTVSTARAEIIFPYLRPFETGIAEYFADKGLTLDTTFLYPEVYDTTETFAQQSLRNRYMIQGEATGEATSQFSLGFNVVEGSVQVLLNGTALVPNIDYYRRLYPRRGGHQERTGPCSRCKPLDQVRTERPLPARVKDASRRTG